MLKRILYITISLLILHPCLAMFYGSSEAAAGTEYELPVYYAPDDILFETADGYQGSNKPGLTMAEVTVPTTEQIAKVEIRDMNNQIVKTLVNSSGNKYKADSPVAPIGTFLLKSAETVSIPQGYFEWFRDPNKKVWMYDFTDPQINGGAPQRYYLSNGQEYDRPPSGTCSLHVQRPTDPFPTYPSGYNGGTAACDEATDFRQGVVSIGDMKVVGYSNITIPATSAAQLNFDDADFEFVSTGTLEETNVVGITKGTINPTTLAYRFNYTAKFNVPEDLVTSDDINTGRVIRWFNKWELKIDGTVYKYPKMKIVYTTVPPSAKTNLSFPSITALACVAAGDTATFNYKLMNSGPATTNAFKVKISTSGVDIITHNFATGIGKETKDGNFTYAFPSSGVKTINFTADSDNVLDLDPASQLTATLTVDVKATCDEGPPDPGGCSLGSACPGELTGKLTVDEPQIEWKDKNTFKVTVDVPTNSCKPVKGRFKVTQGSIEYAYGWTSTISTQNFDTVNFKYHSTDGYPGGIQVGSVQVIYFVEDTCGRTSIIGPDNFTIIKVTGVPTVEVDWYSKLTNAKTEEVIQGDMVYLKAVAKDSKNEDITLGWDYSKDSWLQGLPAKYGWSSPLNKEMYDSIQANTKGGHLVCVTATNESGASATACAYLDVIGPEPVAIIEVGGTLKEDRRIRLDGVKSYSPKKLDLTYDWTIVPVAGQTTAIPSDIQYISPLKGVMKDFKTPKLGKYKVTLVVTDTMGLTDSTEQIVDVLPDIAPVANISGNTISSRQLPDRGLAQFTMLGSALSLDSDIISKRYWSFTYDGNNDGSYNEAVTWEIDEDALVQGWEYPYTAGSETFIISKTGNHILTLKGQNVGKYRSILRVVEIPGQPTNLEY